MKRLWYEIRLAWQLRRLRRRCRREFPEDLGEGHGPAHWKRAAAFGRLLAEASGEVDPLVVEAFACLHDVKRRSNADDPSHGARAVLFIDSVRNSHLGFLDNGQVSALQEACMLHTSALRTDDATINACFDADRADLLRVGVRPDPERMASPEGAALVSSEGFAKLWKQLGGKVVE